MLWKKHYIYLLVLSPFFDFKSIKIRSIQICRIFFCHLKIIFITFCLFFFLNFPFNQIKLKGFSSIIYNALYIILTSVITFNLYNFLLSFSYTSNNWLLSTDIFLNNILQAYFYWIILKIKSNLQNASIFQIFAINK